MSTYHVLSLGAGVQSTALYLMFMRGEIKPILPPSEKLYICGDCETGLDSMDPCYLCGSARVALRSVIESLGEPEPIKLDAAIFADTQEEPRAVYEHLEWNYWQTGGPILMTRPDFAAIIERANDHRFDHDPSLLDDIQATVFWVAELESQRAELLKACEVAQVWLANCMPIGEITVPKPLPLIADAIDRAKAEGSTRG
jgi:hypothetical protein